MTSTLASLMSSSRSSRNAPWQLCGLEKGHRLRSRAGLCSKLRLCRSVAVGTRARPFSLLSLSFLIGRGVDSLWDEPIGLETFETLAFSEDLSMLSIFGYLNSSLPRQAGGHLCGQGSCLFPPKSVPRAKPYLPGTWGCLAKCL